MKLNEKNIEILNDKEKLKIILIDNEKFILVKEDGSIENIPNFLNIKIVEIEWDENKAFLIKLYKGELTDDFFELFNKNLKNGKNIIEILVELDELFKIKSQEYEKFRGDFGEAMFIKHFGGIKVNDKETYDIDLDGNYIEVKTFSPQKQVIKIKIKQIKENSQKFVFPIYNDTNGKNIIELAQEIKQKDLNFSNYIIKKYKNTNLEKHKFKDVIPLDITSQIDKNFELPKNFIGGTIEIFIEI